MPSFRSRDPAPSHRLRAKDLKESLPQFSPPKAATLQSNLSKLFARKAKGAASRPSGEQKAEVLSQPWLAAFYSLSCRTNDLETGIKSLSPRTFFAFHCIASEITTKCTALEKTSSVALVGVSSRRARIRPLLQPPMIQQQWQRTQICFECRYAELHGNGCWRC